MVVCEQFLASVWNNHHVFIIRDKNRPKNDGKPGTVRHHKYNSNFQFFTVSLQWFTRVVGKLTFFVHNIVTRDVPITFFDSVTKPSSTKT